MRRIGDAVVRVARRAAALAERREAPYVVFAAALALWWIEAVMLPLEGGRDVGSYIAGYAELFQSDPIDLSYVLNRMPLSLLVVGGALDLAGGSLAEPIVSLLYAASATAWFLAARMFGGAAGLLMAALLLTWPSYVILFHELSSDSVYATAFAGWSLLAVYLVRAPTPARMGLVGLGIGVLTLVRPASQALVVLAAVPLLFRTTWKVRLVSSAACAASVVVVLAGWVAHNAIRFDNAIVARGGNATVPFYRAYLADRIVRPSNGPASRELAQAVEQHLLPEEPYRSYGITLREFFDEATPRMHEDLASLSDRLKGWHSNHRWLRDVGVEAVRAHPWAYLRGVASTTWGLLREGVYRSPTAAPASEEEPPSSGTEGPSAAAGGRLPRPSEGELIPAPHDSGVATPDGSIYTVWTSPIEHHLVFVHPGDKERYETLQRRITELESRLPTRSGRVVPVHRLNQMSRWFPPPVLWLVIGVLAIVLRRPRNALAFSVPALAAGVVVIATALGLPLETHYSAPVAPAFFLLAAAGLLGERGALRPSV